MSERLHLREGWASLVLLLLVLLTMAWSFQAGGLDEGLRILPGVVVLGVLVGFVSAKARLPGLVAHPLGLAVGVALCFLLVSTLVVLPLEARPAAGQPADWLMELEAKGQALSHRLQVWLAAALHAESNADPLPFVAQMAAVSWLLAFYGAWFLFRSHWVWGAVLPSGLAVFLSVYYAPPRLIVYFVLYLIWSLILIVRSNIFRRECEWQRHHVVYDPHIGLDFLRDGALLSLMIVAFIWFIPRPNAPGRLSEYFQQLQGPWQKVQEEWSRLYASLSYREQTGMQRFGRTLTLGGSISLTATPMLEVRADEPRYWRGVVLDRYTGTGWVDTSVGSLDLAAGAPLSDWAAFSARKVVVQSVKLLRQGESLLFAAAEPLQVQVPVRVHGKVPPEGREPLAGGGFDLSVMYAGRLGRDRRYVVRSLVSTASIRALRRATTDYPDWVRSRYLQVPETLPARVRRLADDVAGAKPTPYDQAVALETYLRGLRYSQSIDAPPPGQDAVDYFLFTNEEGYCTYYASAMVLMCRSLGIPARLAQGYAAGEYDAGKQAYVVRESDSHAWPEVFFPGYGWIEFEPTPTQPTIQRPTGDEEGEPGAGDDLPPEGQDANEGFDPDVLLPPEDEWAPELAGPLPVTREFPPVEMALLAVLGALLAGLGWRYRRRWLALRPIERLYVRLTWAAGPLGVSADPRQTPFEFGRALAEGLGRHGETAWLIIRLYTRERFGRRRATEQEMAAAADAWRRLRPVIAVQTVKRRLARRRRAERSLDEGERQPWTELRPQ